jgi:hypothetical protein
VPIPPGQSNPSHPAASRTIGRVTVPHPLRLALPTIGPITVPPALAARPVVITEEQAHALTAALREALQPAVEMFWQIAAAMVLRMREIAAALRYLAAITPRPPRSMAHLARPRPAPYAASYRRRRR